MYLRPIASALVIACVVVPSLSFAGGPTVIFEDDFESYGVQNPAPDPLGPWTYSGPGGTNASRTFQPAAGAGSNTNSIGWISIVDGSALNTTLSFGSLAGTPWEDGGGNLLDSNVYQLSFMHSAETSNTANGADFSYSLGSSGALSFVQGGNRDGSQTFSGLADGGFNFGGATGKSPERLWDVVFTGSGLTTGEELDLQIARVGGHMGTNAFSYFDDVQLTVSGEIPPMENTGSRIVYDNALGSPLDQDWTGSELSGPGVDADLDGRIDGVTGDVASENHGPVIASTGDAAWQYNDDWTQDATDDGIDNGTFIYPVSAATAANMNEDGFTYSILIENLGTDGGFLSIGALSDGTTGLFGTGASARTRWGIAASEVPVDAALHEVSWTWDPAEGTMTVLVDGNPAGNIFTGGTNALFGGSIPGGAVFTWGDNTTGNPNTA